MILVLQLPITNGTDQITGSVSFGTNVAALSADRALFNARTNPAPQSGRYTFTIPPSGATGPQGAGYGTITISLSGVVTFTGKLADNVSFSATTSLAQNGSWPFFLWLSSGKETVSGQVTVRDTPNVSDMDGTLNWFRRPMNTKLFSDGFATQVPFVGSVFTVPAAGTRVLNMADTVPNMDVAFTGGNLNAETDFTATLDVANRFTGTGLRGTFNRANGLMSGTFANPTSNKTTSFSGVAMQKSNTASGFFLGLDQSGLVTMGALPAAP